ncbi:hypothetical protein [Lentibacillus halodurans]|uniref:hypothetical protein n=1 Tax=Lentibacillus halodurans TaxID=237679 RepID=UPI000AA71B7C
MQKKVDMINHEKSPIVDNEIEDFLANRNLNQIATSDHKEAFADSVYVIISIPTNSDPD